MEKMSIELEKKIRNDIQREENEKRIKKIKVDLGPIKPYLYDTVTFSNKTTYDCKDFVKPIYHKYKRNSNKELQKNNYYDQWELKHNCKASEFVSDVNVNVVLIENPKGPGLCENLVVYTDKSDKPHIYPEGNLSTQRINRQLQLENTSIALDSKWSAEAYRMSIRNCENIYFFDVPEHMGWNKRKDGSLAYASSNPMLPGLETIFSREITEHTLAKHEEKFDDVVKNYREIMPIHWKAKLIAGMSIMTDFLPFFAELGLTTDYVPVISYDSEVTKKGIVSLSKMLNCNSTVLRSICDGNIDIRNDLETFNDVPVLYTYSSTIEGSRSIEKKFTDICLDLKSENGISNPTRKVVVVLTDTPVSVPNRVPAYFLYIDKLTKFGDIERLQKENEKFHWSLIDFIFKNQDATRSLVREAYETAKARKKLYLKNVENSNLMMMILATAIIMMKIKLVDISDLIRIIRWFSDNATSRTTISDRLSCDIGASVSKAICDGKLRVANQFAPPYYRDDGKTAFIAEIDNSINVDSEVFEKRFLSNIKSTDKRNTVLRSLKDKHLLIATKDYKRDLKIKYENCPKMPISVYSLSNAILNEEARKVVEQGLVSDVFHMIDKEPRCFFSFIIHSRFKKVAGQVIESYNAINPFVAVSGSPGSGKSDFLTMQALQRAKAGDTVLIFDPTNSFCEYELISHKIPKELIDDVFLFWDMSKKGWPIDLMDFSGCANDEQMIERLSSMLISGTHFTGCNQLCILNCAVENIVKNFKGCNTDIRTILDKVLKDKGKQGEVKRRVMTLFNTIARNTETPPGWDKLLENKGKIIVISTGNATVKVDCNPLDIVLDSFYSYKDSHRDGNVTLVLDEIQTLNLNEGAPIDILLSKGRKLNVGAYLASQRYSNGKDRLGRIFDYCDTKVFFKPMESCIDAVSAKTHISVDVLRCFEQGECAFIGPAYSEHKGKNDPVRNALVGKTYRPPYVGSYD